MSVYLRAKSHDSNIILTSFRQGDILPFPPPQNEPLKSAPRLRLKYSPLIPLIPLIEQKNLFIYGQILLIKLASPV